MPSSKILLAGATGALGSRIALALVSRGASVTALVRRGSSSPRLATLRARGVTLMEVELTRNPALDAACVGATCVVSALSGLEDVIVDAQSALLDAAVGAGCRRFIPSDFAMDFFDIPEGDNRNFDLRRRFKHKLDATPIAATSILNGAFADLLTGKAPFLLPKFDRVLAWGDVQPKMDFTTMDDVATYTAAAALDPTTPRALRIAGDQVTARELAAIASDVSGRKFKVFRAGSLRRLSALIRVARAFDRAETDVFPPWQGMQYMRDMYAGRGRLEILDNARYPDVRWTSVREVLARDPRLHRVGDAIPST